MSLLCNNCRKTFQNWQRMAHINYKGVLYSSISIEDIERNTANACELCGMIFHSIPQNMQAFLKMQRPPQDLRLSVDLRGIEKEGSKFYVVRLGYGKGVVDIYVIPVTDLDSVITAENTSTSTHSEQSLSLAESWLQTCTENHDCLSASAAAFPRQVLPSRLISLHDGKVRLCTTAELAETLQYVTLSHCWGFAKQFTLNNKNIDSLLESIPVRQLSKTFQDAIFLTQRFGYYYLWIDSLCIIQDDPNDWRHESSLMASVYGGSALNIAASHAENGSVGCFVQRSSSNVAPCRVSLRGPGLSGTAICVPSDFYTRGLLDTPLGHRAWAFQERLLSPRTLYFSATQIFWGCQRFEACESFPSGLPSAVRTNISTLLHDNGISSSPSLYDLLQNRPGIWSDIVLGYSAGLLTRQNDKLVAVSGVARLKNQAHPDIYLAGLWRKDLEWQLLWSVNSMITDQYAIFPKDFQFKDIQPFTYRAPSWTWAAVNGDIRQQFPDTSPSGTSGFRLCIEVVSSETTVINQSDPFGAVSGGRLALLTCGLSVVQAATGYSMKYQIAFEVDHDSALPDPPAKDPKMVSLTPSWDFPERASNYGVVYYLPVWTEIHTGRYFFNEKRQSGGLLLVPTTVKNEYKRVGRAGTKRGSLDVPFSPSGLIQRNTDAEMLYIKHHQHDSVYMASNRSTIYII